jgi:cytochrome c553
LTAAGRVPVRAAFACAALVLAAGCSDAPAATPPAPTRSLQTSLSGETLAGRLGCVACHADMPPRDPAFTAPPIQPGALPADSVLSRLHGRADHVPDFHLDEAEAVALALFVGDSDSDASFRRTRDRHHEVDEAVGRRVYIALNCAGCHATPGIEGRATAPPLGLEERRVRTDWLRRFLLEPAAVRPFGAIPGTGSRMPRFALSTGNADSLIAFLTERSTDRTGIMTGPHLPAFEPAALSAFDTIEARRLIESRFSCLGCHALDGRGGRIAPDLATVGHRLKPAWIRAMLETPHRISTDGVMPPTPAPSRTLDFLASWLSMMSPGPHVPTPGSESVSGDTTRAGYLSLVDNQTIPWDQAGDRTYLRLCASCHGADGDGNGWNAPFLHARPAVHSDSAAMSLRSDDVLFDAIAAGARFLDRSPEMPGFGAALEPDSVRSLVAHIRELCRCSGPAWSRDGSAR